MDGPLGSCCRRCADAETGVLLAVPSAIDHRHPLHGESSHFSHKLSFFTPVSTPCVVLGSDWLMTFSNMFSDLLQHFHHIDTVDTKMLASDWLL